MAQLDIPRGYEDGEALLEADLDAVKTALTDFFNSTKLNDDNFRSNSITASTKVADSTVTTIKLDDEAVTTGKLPTNAVTTAKLADSAVTTDKIADLNITTAKIANSNITNAKFANGSITSAKIPALGEQTASTASILIITPSLAETDITNASVSITTTGRPVLIYALDTGTTSASTPNFWAYNSDTSTSTEGVIYRIYRGATLIATFTFKEDVDITNGQRGAYPAWQITTTDAPAAGTYTYKVTAQAVGSTTEFSTGTWKLLVYEVL
jgi:hypothetical protein